jgi:hypothetical protein
VEDRHRDVDLDLLLVHARHLAQRPTGEPMEDLATRLRMRRRPRSVLELEPARQRAVIELRQPRLAQHREHPHRSRIRHRRIEN